MDKPCGVTQAFHLDSAALFLQNFIGINYFNDQTVSF